VQLYPVVLWLVICCCCTAAALPPTLIAAAVITLLLTGLSDSSSWLPRLQGSGAVCKPHCTDGSNAAADAGDTTDAVQRKRCLIPAVRTSVSNWGHRLLRLLLLLLLLLVPALLLTGVLLLYYNRLSACDAVSFDVVKR
jgi:hypothetical protein